MPGSGGGGHIHLSVDDLKAIGTLLGRARILRKSNPWVGLFSSKPPSYDTNMSSSYPKVGFVPTSSGRGRDIWCDKKQDG